MQRTRPLVAGLDQCPAGWLAAVADAGLSAPPEFEILPDLLALPEFRERRGLAVVAVDVPIGLAERDGRPVDTEARRWISPRHSSVFSPPIRSILHCRTWEEANERSKAAHGKGISVQGFGILPGIRDMDSWIRPEDQDRVVEVHPEVCFRAMKGGPLEHYKKSKVGEAERIALLARPFQHLEQTLASRPRGAQMDDLLDALAALWTAARHARGESARLGGDLDSRGLRMEMVY